MEPSLKEKITRIFFAEKWATEEWFKVKSQPNEVRKKGQLWSLMLSLLVVSRRKKKERWLLLTGEGLHSGWNEISETP